MDPYTLLVIGHLAGTVLAIGGATMIEVHLNKALADGEMSLDERGLLGLDFSAVRIGLLVSVYTGLGFIVLYYMSGQEVRLQNPVFWAKMLMVVIVAVNALLLQAHKISLYWGSALSFVSWWMVGLMGVFTTQNVRYGFIELMVAYIVLVVVGAYVLHKFRQIVKNRYVST